MFVAVGQYPHKFWPCAVFDVMGGGGKAGAKPCGANAHFLKKENFENERKIKKIEEKKF